MKKVTLFAAMAALVLVSCNKEENLKVEMSNHTITASMETESPDTRTAFDRNGGALYWIPGDDIAVLNTSGSFTEYTLTSGAGTANGTFEGTQIGDNSNYALHPYSSHKYENEALTFNLPSLYTYGENEKGNEYGAAPMIAYTEETNASNFYFEHLGGAFCFTINNIPANTTYFAFVADEQITGNFAVETNAETSKFEISLPDESVSTDPTVSAVYSVTINFPAENEATNKKFFIPLPVGTIDGFTISLGTAEGETWSYTSTASNTITRRKLLAMPEVTLNATVDGTVFTEVASSNALKAIIAEGGNVKLTDNITLQEALVVGSSTFAVKSGSANEKIIIDLNSKKLTIEGSNINNGLINNSNLSIIDGSIYFNGSTANGAAICNNAQIQLDNVNVTSVTSSAFRNYGDATVTKLDGKNAADATVTAVINGGEFISNFCNKESHSTHRYAVHGYMYSNLTMTGSKVKGSGGVSVDVSFATLNNVTAEHTCTYGAHDLYVAAGNATVVDCTFANAAAYSDDQYGNAVVNGTVYEHNSSNTNGTTVPIVAWTEIATAEALKTAFANGGSYKLTSEITLNEALTATKPIALDLNSKKLTIEGSNINNGLVNNSNLSIKNGSIYFNGSTANGAAICNNAQIQLDNVNVTSVTSSAFRNYGDATVTKLDGKNAADATVTAVINGGEFISNFCNKESHSTHRYAVHGYMYSNLTMTGSKVKGSGGVSVDVSFATLNNVTAEHTCTYGAHDLYVAAGNATVNNCTFANAAAYSDDQYGNAVVNGTTYNNGTTAIALN